MSERQAGRRGVSLLGSVALHAVLYLLPAPPTSARAEDPIAFEVAELPPPPPPEPEPEPEPPEPEPPEPEAPSPPPKPTRRVAGPPETPPAQAEPPPRFELPPDQIADGSQSGVSVHVGSSTAPPPNGPPGPAPPGRGGKPGPGTGVGGAGGADPWRPIASLDLERAPMPIRVPEIPCPAVREHQVSGTVRLRVQVRRDGTVRSVKVLSAMGHGCDPIAIKALRSAKFSPAVGSDGSTADYELEYEYVFQLDE